MAKRKKAVNRRGSRKRSSGGIPAWFWLLGGILIGLGVAVALMVKGYLPEIKQHLPVIDSKSSGGSDSALINENEEAAKPTKPRYDFFTVLPEMEVVVPEQELKRQAANKPEPVPQTTSKTSTEASKQDSYILQVGSFKNSADAEQMKARLAMMGSTASVQTVTVNGQTWHRVRIGPFKGARRADEMRRLLSDNQIDTLVMKVKP
jgi:cell division septation protein DedD